MLVGGVIRHEIENQLEAAFMDSPQQLVEVGQGPEDRVDVAVVGDVVAEISHGRGVEGRNPNPLDAQPGQVIQPLQDALKIADAIAVCVLEGARIHLVKNAVLPPHR